MSRTYDVTLPVTAYTQVYSIASNPRGATVVYTLSAETMLATPPLSGNGSVCQFKLSADFGVSSNGISLSATPTAVMLYFPSTFGDQSSYGYITTSTYSSAASGFTATLNFRDLNFLNTVVDLSGNNATSIIQTSTVVDNPMYTLDNATTDGDKVNSKLKTVGTHVRGWSLNG